MKHNGNVVWYLKFKVAIAAGCSTIETRVMTMISYLSGLSLIKLLKTDLTFFCHFILSFQHISELCHWLLHTTTLSHLQCALQTSLRSLCHGRFSRDQEHLHKQIDDTCVLIFSICGGPQFLSVFI